MTTTKKSERPLPRPSSSSSPSSSAPSSSPSSSAPSSPTGSRRSSLNQPETFRRKLLLLVMSFTGLFRAFICITITCLLIKVHVQIFLQTYESRLDFYLKQDARYRDQFDPKRIQARQKNAVTDQLLFWLRWLSTGSNAYQSVGEDTSQSVGEDTSQSVGEDTSQSVGEDTSDEVYQSVVIENGEGDKVATLAM